MRTCYPVAAAAVAVCLSVAGESVAEPALVVDVTGKCVTLDGEGNVVVANTGQVVATYSDNGNATLKCKVEGVTPAPDGTAVRWDYENTGIICNNLGVGELQRTTRWWVQVSASGNSMITCQFPDFPGG